MLLRSNPWRSVVMRTGIVESPLGAALHTILPLFRAGLGGPLSTGRAFFPTITIDDVAAAFLRVLVDERAVGVVNAVGAHNVCNGDYARMLGRVLGRPAVLRVPAFA